MSRTNVNEHLESTYTLAEFIEAYGISWEKVNEYYGNLYDIIIDIEADIKDIEEIW